MIDEMTIHSTNFTLEELVFSDTAIRHELDNTPPPIVVENLQRLVDNILQPLRDLIDTPIIVTSGFRSPMLNAAIGGSKFSQHMVGQAADIRAVGLTPKELAEAALDLPFDQLIWEFKSWVHISFDCERTRNEVLTAAIVNGRTQYTRGLA